MNRSKRQRTTRKLIVVAFAMICLFGMVVYAETATSYDKNGKNVAYQGAYSATKAVATAKANGVVKGTGKCWINDNQGSRITQIWQKTLSK